ncbi:MAG: phytanoyl-CoA dioxygenase family protein [Planctomycetota bacterium]
MTATASRTTDCLDHTLTLTADNLATYDDAGYWISPKLIDDETIAALREAHDRLWAGDFDGEGWYPQHPASVRASYDPHAVRKCDNGWWVNDAVQAMVTAEVLGSVGRQLMRCDRVRLWHDQVIYKPPTGTAGNAGNIGWHQDCGYWKAADTTNMVTAWIALQDTDLANGGMRSIAGSQKWGLIEDSDTFFDQDLEGLHDKYSHLGEWRDEPCVLPAGHASFHHGLCFHGSGPNTTDQPRLSIVAHLMPDGTAYTGTHCHANVPLLGPRPTPGTPWTDPICPVVGEG